MATEKTTKEVREEGLDQFYTKPLIAKQCIDRVGMYYPWSRWDLVLEPSAGNGSFLLQIPTTKRKGLDVEPKQVEVEQQDFLEYIPSSDVKEMLVMGNPPFGKSSSLAIRFFNYSAQMPCTKVIAFIVPRTFRRISVHQKLDLHFELVYDEDIPLQPCAFEPAIQAKCCFQIWQRSDTVRVRNRLATTHEDWEFVELGPRDERNQPTPPLGADFAIRAYGGRCGEIQMVDLERLRPKSWHWIRSHIDVEVLRNRFQSLNYEVSQNTARQNSIGKGELVALYREAFS